MITSFHTHDGFCVTYRVERRMVGEELYVMFTPAEIDPEAFADVIHSIRAAVLKHLLFWPNDKYLARFVIGEHVGKDEECWHEVQFKDRDGLQYPTWQRMIVSPYLNSKEAA